VRTKEAHQSSYALNRHDGAHGAAADGGEQALKPGPGNPGARNTQVIVDDHNV
jgi:hypothetical protein